MNPFTHHTPYDFDPIFTKIGKEAMLISAAADGCANTMTASWGGCGVLWNKPIAICFIRPQRHTFSFTEQSEFFSLAFFGDTHREALAFCGTKSGRDYPDKFAAAGLTCAYTEDGIPYPDEAKEVLICRKIYVTRMKKEEFLDPSLLAHYPIDDFHQVYVGEIVDVLKR
ncbi:MAG: flavin reductase family protein [Ruminococcaceae bacterium]|nr:flavin reductase family protein [Oscillospiraceae bacterium]